MDDGPNQADLNPVTLSWAHLGECNPLVTRQGYSTNPHTVACRSTLLPARCFTRTTSLSWHHFTSVSREDFNAVQLAAIAIVFDFINPVLERALDLLTIQRRTEVPIIHGGA